MKRIICHLDMDAFFASVEERSTPRFKGLPIVVGSEPGENGQSRGVVSTANYKAREYGIHSAMPITVAWKISQEMKKIGKPEVIFLPVDFEMYEKTSANIFEIIKKYSNCVEPASIDEFYFDLSFAENFKKAELVCKKIKKEILEKEKITCSIGIGPNKLISKIAAGIKKPNGLFLVKEKDAEKFLENLKIRKIPGVGPKTEERFSALGGPASGWKKVLTVKDLKEISKEKMQEILGKPGLDLYLKCRGIDNSKIVTDREIKSIGEQSTFPQNTLSALFVCDQLENMCQNVFKRFTESGFDKFKALAIVVRFADFETKTSAKSFTLRRGSGQAKFLGTKDFGKFKLEALKLMLPFLDKRKNPRLKKIRLIGVKVEKLEKCGIIKNQQNLGL